MKQIAGILLVASLSACGGGNDYDSREQTYYERSMGPIGNACMSSDRKARSMQLCHCIQNAANVKLNASEQSRAVSFFRDPHQAQVVRQSERQSDEEFWQAYKSYVDYAKATCSA